MRDDSTDTIRLTELFFARDEEALRETIPMTEEDAGELPGLLGAFLARCDSLDRQLFVGRYWYARRCGIWRWRTG